MPSACSVALFGDHLVLQRQQLPVWQLVHLTSSMVLSTVQSSTCCFMLAAEDGERSQDQQGLQEGQAHAGVLQDAMFRWEPSVACRNTRTAPACVQWSSKH